MQLNKFNYHILVAVIILLVNSSCQRVIDLKLDSAASQIVIEGNVTNVHGAQYVTISQSVPFTNTNTFPPVSKATVTITDDRGNTYNLVESTTPGTYISVFTGRPGATYTLSVIINGKTYTGSSTMPQPVFFDPLSYSDNTFKKNTELITVNYQDPINTPNQYRFVMYVNHVQVKSVFAFNDQFIDGKYVSLDLEPFGHVPLVSSGAFTPVPLLWLSAIDVALIALGVAAFRRRDVQN